MQPLKKPAISNTKEKSSLDYSFLFSKLEQLSKENALYRKAFAQIKEVANKVAGGNLTARIIHQDESEKITATLSAINNAYDFTENYILASEESQILALQKQDEFRRDQLRALRDYFEQQVAPALR